MHSNILKVDNILTSFGHASTISNVDATCFIPYFEFQYDLSGKIVGMKVLDYLLENSRVSIAQDGGRTFHVFYDILDGLSAEEKAACTLTDLTHFQYLTPSIRVAGPQDRSGILSSLKDDMKSLGIGRRQQASIWKLLATILHLGNIVFVDSTKQGEPCSIKNIQKLQQCASLLGVPMQELQMVLTYKMKKVGKDSVSLLLNSENAQKQRDSFARSLYRALFGWILDKLNEKLCRYDEEWSNFISLLDLPGFSGLDIAGNGFERLLINYSNEYLNYFILENLVGESKNEFENEGIKLDIPKLDISRETLDLLQLPKYGLLKIIDTETVKSSSDSSIITRLVEHNPESSKFVNLTDRSQYAFGIHHYGGIVEYDCRGFSELNSDIIQADFVSLIRGSPENPGTDNAFLRSIFSDRLIATALSKKDSSVVVAAGNKLSRFPSMKRKQNQSQEEQVDISMTIGHQVLYIY
jgi:chitin synthase